NALGGGQSISLPAGTFTLTRAGANDDLGLTGDLDVLTPLTIAGAGVGSTILDGGGIDRVFDVQSGGGLDVSGLTIRNGHASGDGGGIRSAVALTVAGNSAPLGSGIFKGNGTLEVQNTIVATNSGSGQCFPISAITSLGFNIGGD